MVNISMPFSIKTVFAKTFYYERTYITHYSLSLLMHLSILATSINTTKLCRSFLSNSMKIEYGFAKRGIKESIYHLCNKLLESDLSAWPGCNFPS